jgi:hypothetical protein
VRDVGRGSVAAKFAQFRNSNSNFSVAAADVGPSRQQGLSKSILMEVGNAGNHRKPGVTVRESANGMPSSPTWRGDGHSDVVKTKAAQVRLPGASLEPPLGNWQRA